MYNFEKFERLTGGRKSGIRVTVTTGKLGQKRINLWQDYMKRHADALYASVFYDAEKKALGIKLSSAKIDGGYHITATNGINSNSFSFPDGVYDFQETTNEGIDVFINSENK